MDLPPSRVHRLHVSIHDGFRPATCVAGVDSRVGLFINAVPVRVRRTRARPSPHATTREESAASQVVVRGVRAGAGHMTLGGGHGEAAAEVRLRERVFRHAVMNSWTLTRCADSVRVLRDHGFVVHDLSAEIPRVVRKSVSAENKKAEWSG